MRLIYYYHLIGYYPYIIKVINLISIVVACDNDILKPHTVALAHIGSKSKYNAVSWRLKGLNTLGIRKLFTAFYLNNGLKVPIKDFKRIKWLYTNELPVYLNYNINFFLYTVFITIRVFIGIAIKLNIRIGFVSKGYPLKGL